MELWFVFGIPRNKIILIVNDVANSNRQVVNLSIVSYMMPVEVLLT